MQTKVSSAEVNFTVQRVDRSTVNGLNTSFEHDTTILSTEEIPTRLNKNASSLLE